MPRAAETRIRQPHAASYREALHPGPEVQVPGTPQTAAPRSGLLALALLAADTLVWIGIFSAFLGLLQGSNFGKVVVKVAE